MCVFGIGTGLLVDKILEKLSGDSILIIYEPDKKIIEYCKNSTLAPDCSYEERKVYERIDRIITDERVHLYVENDHTTSFQVILESYIDYLGIAGFVHLINSGYAEAYSSSCIYFYRELEDFRVRLLANKNTELHFMDEYIDYSFRNVQLCKKLTLANELKKIVPENIPAVIVSAGPSLNKNVEELRKVKGHFFIVAVDTAVQSLLKRDIIPDLWVTIDPQKPLDFFKDERSYDIKFDLQVKVVESPNKSNDRMTFAMLNMAYESGNKEMSNVFRVMPDNFFDNNTNGETKCNLINIKDSQKHGDTGKHELGHSLGMTHSYNGIMTAASSDFNRSEDVAIINIKEMINAPLKGKVNKECNNPAGKGTIINNSGYTNDQLKNGKIIR